MIDKATATMGEASPPQYEPGSNASQLPLGKTRQSGVESQNAFELAPSASLPHISTSQSQVEQPETVVSTTNSERDWTIVLSELQNELSDLRSKEKRIKFVQSILDKCPSMYKGKGEALMKRYTGETEVLEQRIQRHMEQLSRTHPDPLVRAEWAGKSQAFAQLIEEEKKGDRDHTSKYRTHAPYVILVVT